MVFIFIYGNSCEGLFTQKNPRTTPNKIQKIGKIQKIRKIGKIRK